MGSGNLGNWAVDVQLLLNGRHILQGVEADSGLAVYGQSPVISFVPVAAGRPFEPASTLLWCVDDHSSNSAADDWAVAARVGLHHPQFGR